MDLVVWIKEQYAVLNALSPIAAGVILASVMGVVYASLRGLPGFLYKATLNQCITSLTFTNAGAWSEERLGFTSFMGWFIENKWARHSRNISMITVYDKVVFGPGFGRHFFFYKGKLFWFNKEALASSGTHVEKERITIVTFGRDQEKLKEVVTSFMPKPEDGKPKVYVYEDNSWQYLCEIPRRELKTVIIEKATKDELIKKLDEFAVSEDWFKNKGLAWKMTCILHGVPGTGKTSLIKALASHYGKNVASMNITSMSDSQFEKAISSLPDNTFLLIEDFDSSSAFKSRGLTRKPAAKTNEPPALNSTKPSIAEPVKVETLDTMMFDEFSRLTLTKVLNTLDGVVSLDGSVIFMTTNCLEKIDEAVTRKGRVDHIWEIKLLQDAEVREYINLVFPDYQIQHKGKFAQIAGCDLQALFLEHRFEPAAFELSIPTQQPVAVKPFVTATVNS